MCKALAFSRAAAKAPALADGARQLLQSLQAHRGQGDFRLSLEPNWRVALLDRGICGARGESELHFGGEIVFHKGCLERQVLTVVIIFRAEESSAAVAGRPYLVAEENHVVRRFHFDFDRTVAGGSTPVAHMQFGGQLNNSLLSLPSGCTPRYEIFDQLDCPRLPWAITDLTIVLDTFLRQFDAGLEEFLGGSGWRNCVMSSERLWLADFFRNAGKMLASTGHRKPLYEFLLEESAFG